MSRRIAAFLSDTHAGHRLGLINPATRLVRVNSDGAGEHYTPELTHTQVRLWTDYQRNLARLRELAGTDAIVAFHDGDATQGDNHGATIPDITREDQREIAVQNLLPFFGLDAVTKGRLLTGTEVHVPENAEARIAFTLAQATGKDVRVYHHERVRVGGLLFDIAHHGPPPGSRDWLRGNVATLYLRDRIYRDRRMGRVPASVYVRGHYHEWVHVTLWETWAGEHLRYDLVVIPSFCGLGEYGRKITRSEPSLTTGLGAFEIEDGNLRDVHPLTQTWDLRTEENL